MPERTTGAGAQVPELQAPVLVTDLEREAAGASAAASGSSDEVPELREKLRSEMQLRLVLENDVRSLKEALEKERRKRDETEKRLDVTAAANVRKSVLIRDAAFVQERLARQL